MTDPHPLDQAVWNALTSRQAAFALGEGQARRFAPTFGPLTGAADASPTSLAALAALPPGPGGLWMLQPGPFPAPPGMVVAHSAGCVQMVAEGPVSAADDIAFVDLTDADADEMLALATLTEPGPFAEQTHKLGDFIGLRIDGRLAAMAGERLRPPGFTEVSGVCTHPDFRGHGYAAALMRVVMARIQARGETPFLHAYETNAPAIKLHRSLGFVHRRTVMLTVLTAVG